MRPTWWFWVVAPILAAFPASASAQYFGRNAVQYDRFDFRRYETAHFQLHAYPVEEQGAREAARLVERWYERHARTFQRDFAEKKPFLLYADQPDFQQTGLQDGSISEGTGGFTESLKNRIVLPLTGSLADDDHVIGHELVHAFQFDVVQGGGRGGAGLSRLPLWFTEGMAEYLSSGRQDPHTAMWLRDAIRRDDFPNLEALATESRFFPYRFGQGLVAYMAGVWDTDAVIEVFRSATTMGLEGALRQNLGMPGDTLVFRWRGAVEQAYGPAMAGRTPPEEVGRRILGQDDEVQPLYIAPAVSPDGRYVAFYSARELFTIDLYLAEVETGHVVGRLASAATDPHLDALRFIETSGSWSPDGSRFAYVAYADGNNQIVVVAVEGGGAERRYRTPGIGSIQNLAWSPDGSRIAFSGTVGGIGDLFTLEPGSGTVEQLTDDRYSNLQPAWSPDGRTLAFVTDEGAGTDLDRLAAGLPRIALLEVSGAGKSILRPFPGAKHISPQFSPDGARLYFIADPGGFSDVFVQDLGTGRVSRVTHVATGVSGITATAPALSVAAGSGDVLFTVFDRAGYFIHALPPAPRGIPVATDQATAPGEDGGLLPPAAPGAVEAYLNDHRTGLVADAVEDMSGYRPSLGLSYLFSPQVGIAVDRFGTQLGGAVGAVFSDLLETREVGVAVVAQGEIRDVAAQGYYQNKARRLRWGVSGGHVPYRSDYAFLGPRPVEIDGDTVIANVYDLYTERVYLDQVGVGASYPLSTTRRIETGLAGTRLGYGLEHQELVLSSGGSVVRERREHLPTPDPIHYGEVSGAFVTDQSFFGFTSPIRGSRSRYEVGVTRGDVDFVTLLLDQRRYLFRNPATLAFRVLHYGRYTGDADSGVLTPLFLGYETLVRGYAPESFESVECTGGAAAGSCPVFDRLRGSRMAVANLELRVALFGVERLGLITFPYLPTELSAFADAGAAWGIGEDFRWAWETDTGDRVPVASAGLSARVNVFGALVLEIYRAYPFQRPEKGWHWGFNIAAGW